MVNNRGYTYLLNNGRVYKIGMTTGTVTKRVIELQTGSPTKIKISGYSYNSNALKMEQMLHLKFKAKRLEGEWFNLSADDVATIHHYFESDYIDEYLAPLSERGVEVARLKKEAERKTEAERKERVMIANAERMERVKKAKAKEKEETDKKKKQ